MIQPQWPLPAPGDIVWCYFPHLPNISPGPKPRPAIVVSVQQKVDGDVVSVVYGTSKKVTKLLAGEVAITKNQHAPAYALAGLAYDTKFDFKRVIALPWSDRYFKVPQQNPHGNTPKMGTLHATVMRAIEAAWRAAKMR